jgi:hypothetical protein
VRQEFIMWYLKSAFDAYEKVQDAVQSRLGEIQHAVGSPIETMKRFLGQAPPPKPESGRDSELAAMRRRISELEARLQKPRPRQKRQARAKR